MSVIAAAVATVGLLVVPLSLPGDRSQAEDRRAVQGAVSDAAAFATRTDSLADEPAGSPDTTVTGASDFDRSIPSPESVIRPDPSTLPEVAQRVYAVVAPLGVSLDSYGTLPSLPGADFHSVSFTDERGRFLEVWWFRVDNTGGRSALDAAENSVAERRLIAGVETSVMVDQTSVHIAFSGNDILVQALVHVPTGERFRADEADDVLDWVLGIAADLMEATGIG